MEKFHGRHTYVNITSVNITSFNSHFLGSPLMKKKHKIQYNTADRFILTDFYVISDKGLDVLFILRRKCCNWPPQALYIIF